MRSRSLSNNSKSSTTTCAGVQQTSEIYSQITDRHSSTPSWLRYTAKQLQSLGNEVPTVSRVHRGETDWAMRIFLRLSVRALLWIVLKWFYLIQKVTKTMPMGTTTKTTPITLSMVVNPRTGMVTIHLDGMVTKSAAEVTSNKEILTIKIEISTRRVGTSTLIKSSVQKQWRWWQTRGSLYQLLEEWIFAWNTMPKGPVPRAVSEQLLMSNYMEVQRNCTMNSHMLFTMQHTRWDVSNWTRVRIRNISNKGNINIQ